MITSATVQGRACPICGAANTTCGGHVPTVPIDADLWGPAMPPAKGQTVTVLFGNGRGRHMRRPEADAFVAANAHAWIKEDGPRVQAAPAATSMEQATITAGVIPGPALAGASEPEPPAEPVAPVDTPPVAPQPKAPPKAKRGAH